MPPLTDRAETWREIPGWEGFYAVSNMGRVKGLARLGGGPERQYRLRERLLALTRLRRNNGCNVSLHRNNENTVAPVARLVLLAFVGEPPKGKTKAIHKDGNAMNNRLKNLKWGNQQDAEMLKVAQGRDGGFFHRDRVMDIEWRTDKNKRKVSVIT